MKLKDVFEKSVQFFKDKKFETARLDAELLIAHALKINRVQIYMKYDQPLKEEEVAVCREVIRRRGQGEPVAYILGEKGFFGEIYKVGPGVLIPRPETEVIVEEALAYLKRSGLNSARLLDLGAGSGCIGLSILKNSVDTSLVSVEKSKKAFQYLEENKQVLSLQDRTQTILSAVEDVAKLEIGLFDVITSNPPYIAPNDPQVDENVRKFEPSEALFAEENGLLLVKTWLKFATHWLKPHGIVLFEMGSTQGTAVKKFAEDLKSFSEVQIIKDLSGLDRTLKCVR
jgi:release factor glutamine methyltransferase